MCWGEVPNLPTSARTLVIKDKFKYLGIVISKTDSEFLEDNLFPQLDRLRRDVMYWRKLQLSLIGGVTLFKMMRNSNKGFGPRQLDRAVIQNDGIAQIFIYSLNTPCRIPPRFFKKIDSELRQLLWDGGQPRIALHKLQRTVFEGGLPIPDIRKYYWASQLVTINDWVFMGWEDPGYRVEHHSMGQRGYLAALYRRQTGNVLPPQTQTTISIWREAALFLGWKGKLTGRTPLWDSDLCEVGQLKSLRKWVVIRIEYLVDVWRGQKLIDFEDLKLEYQMDDTDHFRYLQLKHALRLHIPDDEQLAE